MDAVVQQVVAFLAAHLWLLDADPRLAGTAAAALAVVALLGCARIASTPVTTRVAPPYASARSTAPGEVAPVAQSDPDTDARPRPRAPGHPVPAAA
ncbi:hypothetical protein [Solicola sp. PLA-1-18]|uniref:hypothetical protein n=1 Tax=Solicola sp. PLA-1-18 TaxID=3380532 RepID=UPI003B78A78A